MRSTQYLAFTLSLVFLGALPTLAGADEAPEDSGADSYLMRDVHPSLQAVEGENGSIAVGGMLQFYAIPELGEDALRDNGDAADADARLLQ